MLSAMHVLSYPCFPENCSSTIVWLVTHGDS